MLFTLVAMRAERAVERLLNLLQSMDWSQHGGDWVHCAHLRQAPRPIVRTENRRQPRTRAAPSYRARAARDRQARAPGPLAGRLVRWTLTSLVALALVALGVVLLLRTANPPFTAFMAHAAFSAWRANEVLNIEQRWVPLACVPASTRLAVLAAEDQKFAVHRGFDFTQIADARAEAQRGGRVRGASTVSQQTAKNLFLWPGQSWLRKGLEAGFTVLMESMWSKQRIFEVYLNVAEFGPGIYGVEAAARRHFGKPAAALSEGESALLAAVLPNPRLLSASAPSAYVRERQAAILRQMRPVAALPRMATLLQPAAVPGHCPNGA
jgi:monofunctional glycosyltransferase